MSDKAVTEALAGIALTVTGAWLIRRAYTGQRIPLSMKIVGAAGALLS